MSGNPRRSSSSPSHYFPPHSATLSPPAIRLGFIGINILIYPCGAMVLIPLRVRTCGAMTFILSLRGYGIAFIRRFAHGSGAG